MTGEMTVEILREIRDEIRGTRLDLKGEIHELRTEVQGLGVLIDQRLVKVEGAVLEVAQQQRFVVRYLKGLTARDRRLEADVAELRGRVEALEDNAKR